MTIKIWSNGDCKVDYVNQWTLERFSHPWTSEIESISELSKPHGQTPLSMCHIRILDRYCVAVSHPWVLGQLEAEYSFSSYRLLCPRNRKKKQKIWQQWKRELLFKTDLPFYFYLFEKQSNRGRRKREGTEGAGGREEDRGREKGIDFSHPLLFLQMSTNCLHHDKPRARNSNWVSYMDYPVRYL